MERNTFLLKDDLSAFEKTLKKHKVKLEYDDFGNVVPLIKEYDESISFDELDFDLKSVFFYSKNEKKLFLNKLIEDSYQQIDISEEFLEDFKKNVDGDFKLAVLHKDSFRLVFCKCEGKELQFEATSVEDWEDPDQFELFPYFVELAKSKGMKKKKNEDGDKYYDTDEIYDLIYEFRDNLLSGDDTYLKIAPDWFLD